MFQIDLLDPNNSQIHNIYKKAKDMINNLDDSNMELEFNDFINNLLEQLKKQINLIPKIHTDTYLKAVILVCLYE